MSSFYNYNNKLKDRARTLRREQTNFEKLLWDRLRSNQLGYKFRRQHPILTYILDFYCDEKKLAIELDGSQHLEEAHHHYDLNRDNELEKIGITTLRFFDNDVSKNMNDVLEKIINFLKTSP